MAAEVYENLGDATVSLKILSQPLYEAAWLPNPLRFPLTISKSPVSLIQCTAANFLPAALPHLARANAFSCIARFETGLIDLDPGDIGTALALCSEDSIFVAAVVLSDPIRSACLT